jgi:heat shock protein HslJ
VAASAVIAIAASAAAAPTGLEGTDWELVRVQGPDGMIEAPGNDEHRGALLRFDDGRMSGTGGCNRLLGGYRRTGDGLRFEPNIAGTMMACPPPLMAREQAVVEALNRVAGYRVEDGLLTLSADDGRTLLVFKVRREVPLAGTQWRLTAFNNGRGGVESTQPDKGFMLLLRDDGKFAGKACNNYHGGFRHSGNQLALVGPLAATRRLCPEPDGIMEQEAAYFATLERVASFAIDGTTLTLSDGDGATQARFEAVAPQGPAAGE